MSVDVTIRRLPKSLEDTLCKVLFFMTRVDAEDLFFPVDVLRLITRFVSFNFHFYPTDHPKLQFSPDFLTIENRNECYSVAYFTNEYLCDAKIGTFEFVVKHVAKGNGKVLQILIIPDHVSSDWWYPGSMEKLYKNTNCCNIFQDGWGSPFGVISTGKYWNDFNFIENTHCRIRIDLETKKFYANVVEAPWAGISFYIPWEKWKIGFGLYHFCKISVISQNWK